MKRYDWTEDAYRCRFQIYKPDKVKNAEMFIEILRRSRIVHVSVKCKRYRSCSVRQQTVEKGNVPRVFLEKLSLIDESFKRVAINTIGSFNPPSEATHRFILTLLDYATRYQRQFTYRGSIPIRWLRPCGYLQPIRCSRGDVKKPREAVHVRVHEESMLPYRDQTKGDNTLPPDV
ncbi:Zinc finger protein [Plakobranchus ocellatus]|uniref:Zinc finger protein n=1 Tax=Plakobranchus ocellatus TaxID=259542 RepID=A0AAV4D4Q3_9GAST|nr:Zinc finger protein [Plakobranchus ocellatus]